MTDTFYDRVGGEPFFRALVDDFYAGVVTDDVLRPMYPDEDLGPANERLRLFLMQYWGGPTTYSQLRGHPRLRARHLPFHVDSTARDRWLLHMMAAVDKREMAADLREELVTYLNQVAQFLVNNEDRLSNA